MFNHARSLRVFAQKAEPASLQTARHASAVSKSARFEIPAKSQAAALFCRCTTPSLFEVDEEQVRHAMADPEIQQILHASGPDSCGDAVCVQTS